jgi:hypothetical protein
MSFAVHLGAMDWTLVCSSWRCPGLHVRLSSIKVGAGLELDSACEVDFLD